jgi:phospho-N-acetylmuramoyl-pentapeptide-transferase
VLLGPRVIAWLKAKKLGEKTEKGDSKVLDKMMQGKRDTPTMGGLFLLASILIAVALFGSTKSRTLPILVVAVTSLGALGCVDDWLKLSGRSKKGMSSRAKMAGQVVVGLATGFWLHHVLLRVDAAHASRVVIPFVAEIDFGVAYPFFVAFIVVACSNAVNITDGLDGLAGGCLAISSLAYMVVAYVVSRVDWSQYLGIAHVRSAPEVTVFCAAMLGASLGFLWYNAHPAQVFMGDSGSLPLGGALGLIACMTKQEFLLLFVGGIFVVEAASSLLQIIGFKLTGKRLFRIAPLHHHFQFAGMTETKITQRFWICAAVLAVMSLATLKLR